MQTALMGAMILATVLGQGAMASDSKVECTAEGKSLSKNGEGLVTATARLTFTESTGSNGLRTIENVEGKVVTTPEQSDFSYIGNFKIESLTENPKYRPNKYKGYSQFQNFDAADTTGSAEDGMWGQLVLEKDTSGDSFEAHYIFQAGDHMGGTLHLSCRYE